MAGIVLHAGDREARDSLVRDKYVLEEVFGKFFGKGPEGKYF